LRKYEGMFLFDPTVATTWEDVESEVARLMERAGARVILCAQWDERRLAYEIRGRKRGVYALVFFEADEARISDLQRDTRLSEPILRCLLLRADDLTEEEMREMAARPADEAALDGDRGAPPGGARRPDGGDRYPGGKRTASADSGPKAPAREPSESVKTVQVVGDDQAEE